MGSLFTQPTSQIYLCHIWGLFSWAGQEIPQWTLSRLELKSAAHANVTPHIPLLACKMSVSGILATLRVAQNPNCTRSRWCQEIFLYLENYNPRVRKGSVECEKAHGGCSQKQGYEIFQLMPRDENMVCLGRENRLQSGEDRHSCLKITTVLCHIDRYTCCCSWIYL